ncbi:MAG: hypothetical protein Q8S84_00925 [bacterium]|nr:hypothetical protein [bacterium]MDP3380141.1 hypothetical protein [bacterium]
MFSKSIFLLYIISFGIYNVEKFELITDSYISLSEIYMNFIFDNVINQLYKSIHSLNSKYFSSKSSLSSMNISLFIHSIFFKTIGI